MSPRSLADYLVHGVIDPFPRHSILVGSHRSTRALGLSIYAEPERSTHRVQRGGKPKWRRSRLTGFASPTNVPGPDHRLCFSTDTWGTAPPRGGSADRRAQRRVHRGGVWGTPGPGGSSDPPESFGIAGYADCLAGFVAELHLSKPHVAGLSFGGVLALEFIHRHPAIPMTLILASAYAGWPGIPCPPMPLTIAFNRLWNWPTCRPQSSYARSCRQCSQRRPHRRPLKRSA